MKFRVIGSSRETGARMSLEFEAESKAAAERKATQSGMSVTRVEDISDGYVAHASAPRTSRRRGGGGGKLTLLILIIILAAAAWYFWPHIRPMLHR
jgi:hypothetical protein